jgi:hypothetical protein
MKRLAGVLLMASLATCGGDSPTSGGAQPWTRNGIGDEVFDRPASVDQVLVMGSYSGSSSNFVVRCGDDVVVNELLGTAWQSMQYSGTHLLEAGCNPIQIEGSTGVEWSVAEVI